MRLKGHLHPSESCGHYDLYVAMLVTYGLTPDEVDALDLRFIEELSARSDAVAKLEKELEKKRKRDSKGK